MSRDKQIEEMAKILCTDYYKGKCTIDGFDCGEGFCSKREKLYGLYNAGYRKASDVAEEIFAEIEKLRPITKLVIKDLGEWDFDKYGEKFYWLSETKIAELKKKCKESENYNEN